MTAEEYIAARATLGWPHRKIAQVLGSSLRTSFRWQAGETEISEPTARLLRVLLVLRLTSAKRFDEVVNQLEQQP